MIHFLVLTLGPQFLGVKKDMFSNNFASFSFLSIQRGATLLDKPKKNQKNHGICKASLHVVLKAN